MNATPALSAIFTAVIAASNCHAADTAPVVLINRLTSLAGSNAQDCGSVVLRSDPGATIGCARSAMSAGKAYRLAVQFQGEDSLVWQGAARDEHGKLWVVFYDSDPAGGSGANPTLSAVPCRDIRFEVHDGDLINCQPILATP